MDSSPILIFGGTFDPPHRGHSTLPPLVAQRLGCERIVYIPAALNPLKADETPTPAAHRLAMLRLALAAAAGSEISTIEIDRPGPSYTVDTVEALAGRSGETTRLHLLIGSDQALEFNRWKRWRRILELATPVVMVRPPLTDASFARKLREIYPAAEARRWLGWAVEVPQMDIGASALRKRLAAGDDVSELMDRAVVEYIRSHGLYRGSGSGVQGSG